jgi:hypothetical protein
MKLSHFDTELAEEISILQSKDGISIEQSTISRSGFSGHEELVVITTFILSGIAAGFLKKLGEDIWSRLKSVTSRILSKKKDQSDYHVAIVVCVGDGSNLTKFVCTMRSEEDIYKLQLFHEALQAQLENSTLRQQLACGEYHLIKDKTWEKR